MSVPSAARVGQAALRHARAAPARPRAAIRVNRAARAFRGELAAHEAVAPAVPLAHELSVVMTFRVASSARLQLLRTVLERLDSDLAGSGVRLLVLDASPAAYRRRTSEALSRLSLPVELEQAELPLVPALLRLLSSCPTPYFYYQFDDQLTTNLTPRLLQDSCALLRRFGPLVPVVAPQWPVGVVVDDDAQEVRVCAYETSGRVARFRFGPWRPQRPLAVISSGASEFGVFRNFSYGFFFNHLVAPASDYAETLAWFAYRLGTTSAHRIELSTMTRTFGPSWPLLAVPLGDVSLLDLDFEHTPGAVRAEGADTFSRWQAVDSGYGIRAVHSNGARPAEEARRG